MGDLYVWNNIPEYTLRVVKNDEIIHAERIVAGLVSKQTPIFSRPMRKIVFRPKWRVPESIMVRELWPSMLKGGGLMYQFGLQLETKDGQPLDWRKMDWAKEDIRNYNVIQPPGPRTSSASSSFSSQASTRPTCTTRRTSTCSRRLSGRTATAACACAIR